MNSGLSEDLKRDTLDNGWNLLAKLYGAIGDDQHITLQEGQPHSVEISRDEIKALKTLIEFHY